MRDATPESAAAPAPAQTLTASVDRGLAGRIVARAATAPSAHNTQPWLPRIVDGAGPGDRGGLAIELGVERGRTLPVADPTGRDTLLALGCWVEAAEVAAAGEGMRLEVELLPALDDPAVYVRAERDEPVARLRITGVAPGDTDDGVGGERERLDATATTGSAYASDTASRFVPALLSRRLTYRGRVTSAPGLLAAAATVVPSWIRLEPVEARDVSHFSAIGTADTLRVPAVARELASWLRLTPEHPRWDVDGLSADTLLIPDVVGRLLSPVTRRRRLRDAAIAVLRRAADAWRRTLLEVHLDAPGDAAAAEHFVLVVEANELDLGSGVELTRVLNSPLGLPPRVVVEAGRALLRVWLLAAERGAAFAPHSEILDSNLAAGELQFRLGLGRREVPLFVTTVGVPDDAAPARSRRKPFAIG